MSPRRILVTGGSGFVAGHLVPVLRAAFPDAALHLCGVGHLKLELTDAAGIDALVAGIQPDVCIHLAAISAVPSARRDPELAWRVNLLGTLALARAVLAHAPGCSFITPSSAEIYGASFRAGTPLDETALLAPMNTYAATKAATDLAIGAMAGDGLRSIRLRPFNHTGPGQMPAFAVPAFARQVARIAAGLQPPVLEVGALDPFRDFLDVRDVCAAYVAAVVRADAIAPGTVLNIASGQPRRIGDVLQSLIDLAGITAEISTGAALLRPSDIPMACGNADAARAALGWAPAIPWEQTLRDVLADWTERVHTETA